MIYDISPPITANLKVWPGDVPVSREVVQDLARGDNVTLSALHASVHLGAHADAPSHYGLGAPAIDARPLDVYMGTCQVVAVDVGRHTRVEFKHVATPIRATRVLFRTGTFPDPTVFSEDFAALAPSSSIRLTTWACGSSASTRRASICSIPLTSPRTARS
jgi:arylformamidase